jgi:drug/metabolite transporter (DMT)-like permease
MSVASAAVVRPSFVVGALLVLAAGISWSFSGLFVRMAPDLNAWQFIVMRGFGVACAFTALARLSGSPSILRDLYSLGSAGAIVTIAFCFSSVGYIIALKLTTVANVLVLSSTSPLFSAVLGYVVLGERLNGGQAGAVALGFVGLFVTVGGGFEAGGWLGNVCGLGSALGFAVANVTMRLEPRGRDFVPAAAAYGALTSLFAVGMCVAAGNPVVGTLGDTLVSFAAGFLIMGLGFTLFLRGAPAVPAVGQAVLAQTETVFGPLWPWLVFGETPARSTLIGGVIILSAVVAMTYSGAAAPTPNVSN